MPDRAHEQTINTALGEVLQNFGHSWRVRAERGRLFTEGGRPDILIEKPGDWPVVIEAEVGNHRQAEAEAASRLGKQLVANPRAVEYAVALVYPESLRKPDGAALRAALLNCEFEYAALSREADGTIGRIPRAGWLRGNIEDLASLLHLLSVPSSRVDALAEVLEVGVNQTELAIRAGHPIGSALGKALGEVLRQHDDDAGQTRRMAMTVVANALIFHAALAEAGLQVRDQRNGQEVSVRSPETFRSAGHFLPTPLLDHWSEILKINYWPIFHVATEIIRALPTATAVQTLDSLWRMSEQLIAGGVTKSHDLTGVVFQRLIADRKFLATYYTRPAAAALLAALAMPLHGPRTDVRWDDATQVAAIKIGDLACGTGTLLSTTYNRLGLLHELGGGDPRRIHPELMRRGLVGLDVLNIAVHLTAAMLAGTHPDQPFDGECLLTMPYGSHRWGVSVGSLSLLEPQGSLAFMRAAATAGGKGEEMVRDLLSRVEHRTFDIVIMNPPFARHGAREGERSEVHNPAFAAFEATEAVQNELAKELKRVARGGAAHGHAGMASYFVELANRMLKQGGTLALVLPLSSLSGASWEAVRTLWRLKYSRLLVVTIAQEGAHARSFSADTGIAECLVVANQLAGDAGRQRAHFAVLREQPRTTLDGALMGEAINEVVRQGGVRQLEGGPFGGTPVAIGSEVFAELIDCPLPDDGPWAMAGIRSLDLGQTAYQLSRGRLWIEGMSERDVPAVPVLAIGRVCAGVGPHDLDITGSEVKSDNLPQGPFELHDGVPAGASFPCLWNHDTLRERRMLVAPDSHCQLRAIEGTVPRELQARAADRWRSASRIHYNRDLRFNSQLLVVAVTERPTLGGRAWPTVSLHRREHETAFVLWCNSTLGLLCHWWGANKSQDGRGSITNSMIAIIPTLDVTKLSVDQLRTAGGIFDELSLERLLPFDQLDEDKVRAEVDRRLLADVLGLDQELFAPNGPLERLRQKLAAEPQIRGSKQSRVVFAPDGGETSVPRTNGG